MDAACSGSARYPRSVLAHIFFLLPIRFSSSQKYFWVKIIAHKYYCISITHSGVVQPKRKCLRAPLRTNFIMPVLHTGQGNSPDMSPLGTAASTFSIPLKYSSISSLAYPLGNAFLCYCFYDFEEPIL